MPIAISRLSTTPSGSFSSPVLKAGSRGPEVLDLQRKLRAAGFDPQGQDGDFGPKTEAAVKAFQRARGLTVDGHAGPRTLAALSRPVPVSAGGKIDRMLEWTKTVHGAPYAAVNPFRFGDVPWDGKPHKSENGSGRMYHIARGRTVFDCSGFVVAAYRKVGVDLVKHGLTTTTAFLKDTKFLQPVATDALRPGDLILYKPHKGIGHVVVYLGNGQAVDARSGSGVGVRPVNWNNIQGCRRVPVPEIG